MQKNGIMLLLSLYYPYSLQDFYIFFINLQLSEDLKIKKLK